MRLLVLDYSGARPAPSAIKAAGYVGAMRYLTPDVYKWKRIETPEIEALHNAGLGVGFVWETTAARAKDGYAAGVIDARAADDQADARGVPLEVPIFYAVDYDCRNLTEVLPYFQGVLAWAKRPVGAYGNYLVTEGLPDGVRWRWQCAAWSAGKVSKKAHLYQRVGHTILPAIGGTDENHVYQAFPLWLEEGVMLINPMPGKFTSGFGPRPAPLPSPHKGIDLANKIGTPIRAVAAGRVISVRTGSYPNDKSPGLLPGRTGNGVYIDHGGFRTYNGHVSQALVRAGEYVIAGQPVALMGNTGNITGPHLHFEVHVNGNPVDPNSFLKARGVKPGVDPFTVDYIANIQTLLNKVQGSRLSVDGVLGILTISAIVTFQGSKGLVPDGMPGPKTLAALEAAAGVVTPELPAPVPEEDELASATEIVAAALTQGKEGVASAGWVEVAFANVAASLNAIAGNLEALSARVDAIIPAPVDPAAIAATVAQGVKDGLSGAEATVTLRAV